MAHTPGPWRHCEDRAGDVLGANGTPVCSVYGESARAEECDINQALIRSAPELLAALKALLDAQVCRDGGKDCAVCEDAYAAIAKADNLVVEEEDE